ncbi:MAG TPA: hypothetical protein VJT13_16395 [Xanthobacteraceae bacterium]|nr:hypothetical protein [Xanthobacteraceae bacterium]
MTMKATLLASAAIMALGSIVFAQGLDAWDIKDRMGIIIYPTGKVERGTMTEVGHSAMLDRAVALPAGTAIMRSGDKLYLLHDQRMHDGTMMFDRAGNWMSGL